MLLKNESQNSSERFYQYKLEYPLLHPSEKDSIEQKFYLRTCKAILTCQFVVVLVHLMAMATLFVSISLRKLIITLNSKCTIKLFSPPRK